MDPKKLDKIISIIREQMVANAPGTQGGGGESADPKGPFPGYARPLLGKVQKRFWKGKRKPWLDYLKNK
jgi:hypothetical protein